MLHVSVVIACYVGSLKMLEFLSKTEFSASKHEHSSKLSVLA